MSILAGMATGDTQFKLIIPAALKKRLDGAADQSRRSLSAEIVARLEQSFSAPHIEIVSLKPIGLDKDKAAAFVGIDPNEFVKWWKSGQMPQPRMVGDFPIWDREELETAVRKIMALGLRDDGDTQSAETHSVSELAKMWKTSEHHIRGLVKDGELETTGKGRSLRISRASADAFLGRRRRGPEEQASEIIERLRA